jgi:flagellar FliL protein
MTDAAVPEGSPSPKSSKGPLIIGLVLALLGGAGGFYATHQGLILTPESPKKDLVTEETDDKFNDLAFIPLEPLMISMPRSSQYKHLRFRGELEVLAKHKTEVEHITPRIIDVLNGYLRALEVSDIEEAASLTRLRSQMLRRIQIVAGPGRVNDLLIMEFVLN